MRNEQQKSMNEMIMEKYGQAMAEKYADFPAVVTDMQKALKTAGTEIRFAGSTEICRPEIIAMIICEYYEVFNRSSTSRNGWWDNKVEQLMFVKIPPKETADEIASMLNGENLYNFLNNRIHGIDYRKFILPFARYVPESKICSFIAEITEKRKGNAKDVYWAENAEKALLLKPCAKTARYFRDNNRIDTYISSLWFDIGRLEFLDKYLIPDFSNDADGKIKEQFLKEKTQDLLIFCHRSREKITLEHFTDIYMNHPIGKILGETLVWKDNRKGSFIPRGGVAVDCHGKPVTPVGPIKLANVLDMYTEEIMAWKQYLNKNNIKQPFAQIDEPIADVSDKNIPSGYVSRTISRKNCDLLIKEAQKLTEIAGSLREKYLYFRDAIELRLSPDSAKTTYTITEMRKVSHNKKPYVNYVVGLLDGLLN